VLALPLALAVALSGVAVVLVSRGGTVAAVALLPLALALVVVSGVATRR
jgi:hypothetical protein